MKATPNSIIFCAARVNRFQSPPFERPGGDDVLLLRSYQDGDEPSFVANEGTYMQHVKGPNTWRLPTVGEFEHSGELKPWTSSTLLARVEAPFNPPGVPGRDFFWANRDYAKDCRPSGYAPNVLPALRRFDGPLLDQIVARLEARVDSDAELDSYFLGDSDMSTTIQDLQRQINTLQRQVGTPIEGRDKFIQAQSRAEQVYRAFGDSAPPFVGSERLLEYRARLLRPMQKHSRKYKDSDLGKVGDPVAFAAVEGEIYADAVASLHAPGTGKLHAIETKDATGRMITRFVGDPHACWDMFAPPIQYIKHFCTPGR